MADDLGANATRLAGRVDVKMVQMKPVIGAAKRVEPGTPPIDHDELGVLGME
jgi:hypothetical protein